MATFIQNLTTRRDALAARLAELDKTIAQMEAGTTQIGDKPNTTGGQGSQVDHVGYRMSLLEELKELEELIKGAQGSVQQDDLIANGPWEVRS